MLTMYGEYTCKQAIYTTLDSIFEVTRLFIWEYLLYTTYRWKHMRIWPRFCIYCAYWVDPMREWIYTPHLKFYVSARTCNVQAVNGHPCYVLLWSRNFCFVLQIIHKNFPVVRNTFISFMFAMPLSWILVLDF